MLLMMSVATLQARTTTDHLQSNGTMLTATGIGTGFYYNLIAVETTTRGKNGNSLVYVGVTVCNGRPDQPPYTCVNASGSIDGRLLSRRGNVATLNLPDAAAAGLSSLACDEFTCFPTPSTPFPIQVTLRANGFFTNEFDGTLRSTYNYGGMTSRFYSKGQSINQSASVQGRLGNLTLPVAGADYQDAVITDTKNTVHVIARETKQ
jgi:hypothetical protein